MSSVKSYYKAIYGFLTSRYMLYAIALAISIGLYYARASVSIATGALGIIALLSLFDRTKRKDIGNYKAILLLSSLFFMYVLWIFNSSNLEMWYTRVDVNMTYLVVPLGFWAFGPLRRVDYMRVMVIYIASTVFSLILVMSNYALHFEEFNQLYHVGKTIPTPILHIRYSFFVACAAVLSAGLLMDRTIHGRALRRIVAVFGIICFAAVHILAVRTGIVSMYGGILALVTASVIREKRWVLGISTVILIAVIAVGSYEFLPSMRNKIDYMVWDLRVMRSEGLSPEYSDNSRLISMKFGLDLFRQHPLVGVGPGDVLDEMRAKYAEEAPGVPRELQWVPISQYLFWLAAFGLLGTAVFLAAMIYPVIISWRRSYLITGFMACTLMSFFADTTIQVQLGKTMFLFILSVGLMAFYYEMLVDAIVRPKPR